MEDRDMQNFTNSPYYTGFQFNPMLPAQQRLAQMEQQYPQFAQSNVQNMQIPRAFMVMDEAEAKAQQVATDGSITVFINKANNELYTKGLNNDGLLEFKTFVVKGEPKENSPSELEGIKEEIERLKTEMKELKDVKQSDADNAVSRTTKKQSKPDASDANNVRE